MRSIVTRTASLDHFPFTLQRLNYKWVNDLNQASRLFLVAKVNKLFRHKNLIVANRKCAENGIFLSGNFWQGSLLSTAEFTPSSYAINNKNIFRPGCHRWHHKEVVAWNEMRQKIREMFFNFHATHK